MTQPYQRGEDRTARAVRVLAGLKQLWGDEPPPGEDSDLAWLVDALAIDDAHGREDGFVVRSDAITLTSLAQWLTAPQFPDEHTGAWQYEADTGRVCFDEQAQRVLGIPGSATSVERMLLDVHPSDRDHVQVSLHRAATTGEHFRVTFRARSPLGDWHWRTSTGRRVQTATGGVVLGFVTVHQRPVDV